MTQTSSPTWSGPTGDTMPVQSERAWAIAAHLSPAVAQLLSLGWATLAGPLLIWLFNKDRSRVVRYAAAGAFNFTVGLWLVSLASWLCMFTVILIPLGLVGLVGTFVIQVVVAVIAALRASDYQVYRYPFAVAVIS